MVKVEYLIIGLGLAGLAFTEELIAAKKRFLVFEDASQTSSLVAAGVYNPVILKRFSPVWNAKEQLAVSAPFYKRLEKKFETHFDTKLCIKRAFKSIEDQNNWFLALDKPLVASFMDSNLDKNTYQGIIGNHYFGNVKEGGRVDTKKLIKIYREYLRENHWIRFERFEHRDLLIEAHSVKYRDIYASKVVFCEGYGLKKNPYFNQLPLREVKGEILTIYAPELTIEFLLKSTLFVLPLGKNYYKVGATFHPSDKSSAPSIEGKRDLILKLKKTIRTPYKIVDQEAGIRPAVKDRRPMVGVHPQYKQLSILNGLGTRGVMMAPTVAKNLFHHLEFGKGLDQEININRFVTK